MVVTHRYEQSVRIEPTYAWDFLASSQMEAQLRRFRCGGRSCVSQFTAPHQQAFDLVGFLGTVR